MMILSADPVTFHSWWRRSKYPPYGLRKVEAISKGKIVPPERLWKERIDVLGIYVNDPLGKSEIGTAISRILKRDPPYVASFKKFRQSVIKMKEERGFRVIVGGPGAWQLTEEGWIDSLLIGEAEESFNETLLKNGVVQGRKAEHFVPILGPSSMAEVEISRGERKVSEDVVLAEMEVQGRAHGKVNLITQDIASYGSEEEVEEVLLTASKYGKVTFSNVNAITALQFNWSKVKEGLHLSRENFLTPVLNSIAGSCVYSLDAEVVKVLNKSFIYPVIYVPEEVTHEFLNYDDIVIPLPQTERYYEVLYAAWIHDKKYVKFPFSYVMDYVLRKAMETKGEHLRRLNKMGTLRDFLLASIFKMLSP
ncbi:MAG: hypothetical protein QXL04_02755 [Metallosphaera sp.]